MKKTIINDEIIKQISNGDENAFRFLFDIIYVKLIKIALIYLNNKVDAEAVVSDVLFKLWKSRKKLTTINNIDTYLCVSVRNQSFSYLNKHKKMFVSIEDNLYHDIPEIELKNDEELYSEDLKIHIDKVIDSLPQKCKEIFILAKVDGIKYKQISEMLNVSVKTIDSQISIALKKLSSSIKIIK